MIERIVNPPQTEGVLPTDPTSPKPKSPDQETGKFRFSYIQ